MANYEQTHAQIAIAGVADRIGRVVLWMVMAVADYRAAYQTRRILSDLPDSALHDIGLTRGQIDQVAGFPHR